MAYRLPELRDSPFNQLMATLPSLLMRMKENQTAQSNKDREFLQSQKQQARQQFESDRTFRDANEDQLRTEKIQADKDFMSDYVAANNNPHLQYTYLMSRKDNLPYGMNFPTEERRLIKARENYDRMIDLNQESIEADIRASDALASIRTRADKLEGWDLLKSKEIINQMGQISDVLNSPIELESYARTNNIDIEEARTRLQNKYNSLNMQGRTIGDKKPVENIYDTVEVLTESTRILDTILPDVNDDDKDAIYSAVRKEFPNAKPTKIYDEVRKLAEEKLVEQKKPTKQKKPFFDQVPPLLPAWLLQLRGFIKK